MPIPLLLPKGLSLLQSRRAVAFGERPGGREHRAVDLLVVRLDGGDVGGRVRCVIWLDMRGEERAQVEVGRAKWGRGLSEVGRRGRTAEEEG